MKRLFAKSGSSATPLVPLCPSHQRSAATRLEPAVPNRRTTLPFAIRTERPRQRSVKKIVCPSGANAKSQPPCSPLITIVLLSVGAAVDGGGGVGAAAFVWLPPHASSGTAIANEQPKSNARRLFTATLERCHLPAVWTMTSP